MKKNKVNWYEVTFKEVGYDKIYTEKMDGKSLAGLALDWAFEIIHSKQI